jgi:hypothetical protein
VLSPCAFAQWLRHQNIKSYKQSKKVSAAQASIINTHSQQQGKAARIFASQQALRDSSAAKAIVGWKQRSVSHASSNSMLEDQSSDDEKPYPRKDRKHKPKKLELVVRYSSSSSSAKLVPYICGKYEAADPFHCIAVKID